VVEEVVSDTSIRLKHPGCHVYQQDCEYEFLIIPKIDQSDVYQHVWAHLGSGGCLGIFPEGGSHDNTRLLPFKAGVSLMALGTTMKYDKLVSIIPCGLKYFKGHRFRSKVIIEFGRPYQANERTVRMYEKGDKRKAVQIFLKDIEERMREITLTAPSYNEL